MLLESTLSAPGRHRSAPAPPATCPPSRRFGDYEILEEIARGGMGVVYKARHLKLDRIVALKMILAGNLAAAEDVQRFYAEAEAAAILDHPGIVPIFEVGHVAGQHFFAMGFVEGESLSALLASGPLPPAEAARIARHVADAITYAHERGVIHRDLKPANVLIDAHGHPRVTDFGLAKRAQHDSQLTTTGQILGTPNYMPPEQAAGRVHEIGPVSDVCGIGAILYAMLTGRPPFQSASVADILRQVLEREPVSPHQLNVAVPRDLDTICLKCLQKDAHRRYGSARELAAELDRFLRGEPILARPLGRLGRGWRWCRRNPIIAGLLALCASVMLAGTAVSSWFAYAAFTQANRAAQEAENANAARDDARDKLRGALLAQAQAGRWSGRAGRRFQSLEALRSAAEIHFSPELRDEAIACLALADLRQAQQWRLSVPETSGVGVAFDASLERYATYDARGRISIRRIADHAEVLHLPEPDPPLRVEWVLRFSRDGRFLAVKYEGPPGSLLRIWSLEHKKVVLAVERTSSCGAMDFTPDGAQVLVGHTNGKLRLYDLASGAEVREFAALPSPWGVAVRPDGQQIAVSSHTQQQVLVLSLTTGEVERRLPHPAGVRGVAWREDGAQLATACADGRAYLWSHGSGPLLDGPATGVPQPTVVLDGHGNTVTHVLYSRSGDLLASYSWDGQTRLWDVASGRLLVSVLGEFVNHSWFGPDDRQLGFKSSVVEAGVWDVATGRECRTLAGKDRWPECVSPNGHWLVTRDLPNGAAIRLWHLASGKQVATLAVERSTGASFSADGRTLYVGRADALDAWPFDEAAASLGPPTTVLDFPKTTVGPFCFSADGRWAAAEVRGKACPLVVDLQKRSYRLLQGQHPCSGNLFLALSRDGRFVASGTWKGDGVHLWDVAAGKAVHRLPISGNASVMFSPDGRWLVTGGSEAYEFWRPGNWGKGPTVPRERAGDLWGQMCCSADGRFMAVTQQRNTGLLLIDPSDGKTLATLESPVLQQPICFSPDGSRLLAIGDQLQVWDLPLVRRQLAELKLDGDFPNFAENETARPGPKPWRVITV